MAGNKYSGKYVFGLDIGTRNMVGTVGYKMPGNHFVVEAQVSLEHKTRAMLDGQIHDIGKVAESIVQIKEELEKQIDKPLTEVCIAAAGRVLKTIRKRVDYEFGSETVVNSEHVYSLDMLGVEKAYEDIREKTSADTSKYYCVGYSVVQYFLNDYAITVLEDHKAVKIGVELIATFLPDEVVDGLYSAVEKAGLSVANLTLEPIAAINVAIPEAYRLLNIALVDVGAGTSDISIARDGSIEAFGMMPLAGDEITEVLANKYLIDFQTAEKIKKFGKKKSVSFKDIMGTKHSITTDEIKEVVGDCVKNITRQVAEKIIELNGDRPVSAVFVVGGGGKIYGFTESLADYIGIARERVALRGPEVMQNIEFKQEGIKKDSLLVTPIGICLNYYEQKNNFIPVNINGEHIKLYDNDKVSIVDAALQLGLPNEYLFPKRGTELVYTVDGQKRMVRGELGEPPIILLNGEESNLSAPIEANDNIVIKESTAGAAAECEIQSIPEYSSVISFNVNGKQVICPRFANVNGEFVPGTYKLCNNDEVIILNYYTLQQVLDFMDLPYYDGILVNNEVSGPEEKVYENFKIIYNVNADFGHYEDNETSIENNDIVEQNANVVLENDTSTNNIQENKVPVQTESNNTSSNESVMVLVIINGKPVALTGKKSYVLVDVLDVYDFDTSLATDKRLVITLNGIKATFASAIVEGDTIGLYWEDQ